MKRFEVALALGFLMPGCGVLGTGPSVVAPVPETPSWYLYTAEGASVSMQHLLDAAEGVDVIFVGERHNDPGAHTFQLDLLRAVVGSEDDGSEAGRPAVLSLEMFERDVQIVVDEYMADLITETHFLASSRPWANYASDYRPMVELARERQVPVVAANAPRRYANRVSRLGRETLVDLSEQAREWLPPLPYPGPTEAYRSEWDALMGEAGQHGMAASSALDAQALWDASMGLTVHEALERVSGALVLHMAGGFHVERGTGTPEAFKHYRPDATFLVVSVRPAADPTVFDVEAVAGLGDFIVLTDASRLP